MSMSRARTLGSEVSSIMIQTFVNRSPQNPAWVQNPKSSVITTPSPSNVSRRSRVGTSSAVSVPRKPVRSCEPSQNGLFSDLPQRQSSMPSRVPNSGP
jgi:hypothetical protein